MSTKIYEKTKVDNNNNNNCIKVILYATRLKSPTTLKECLKVQIKYEKNNSNVEEDGGTLICDLLNLEIDLKQLIEYGTGFLVKDILEIKKNIESSYLFIDKEDSAFLKEEKLENYIKNIVYMFSEYILDNELNSTTINGISLYNIPVEDFAKHIETSDYKDYGTSNIREKLRDKGYTKCTDGRTDNTVTDKNNTNKRIKVISFYSDKIHDNKE